MHFIIESCLYLGEGSGWILAVFFFVFLYFLHFIYHSGTTDISRKLRLHCRCFKKFSDFLFEQSQLIIWSETRASLRQSSHIPGVLIELDFTYLSAYEPGACIWVVLELISVCDSLKLWLYETPGLLSQHQLYRQKMQGWDLGGKQSSFGRNSNRHSCLKPLLALSEDNLSQNTMAKDWFGD